MPGGNSTEQSRSQDILSHSQDGFSSGMIHMHCSVSFMQSFSVCLTECDLRELNVVIFSVPVVLNPNWIEPTFLKFDLWSPGAGFIPIITSNVLN